MGASESSDTTTATTTTTAKAAAVAVAVAEIKHAPSNILGQQTLTSLADQAGGVPNSAMLKLFDSNEDGFSMALLGGRIEDRGPTLIVIKTKDNVIFGGYASVGWIKQNRFSGNTDCFLYKVVVAAPDDDSKTVVVTHKATSKFNHNFQYLNYNEANFALYNGLGFGGLLLDEETLGGFHLCIEESLRKGRTQSKLLTFPRTPCLSAPTAISTASTTTTEPGQQEQQQQQKKKKRRLLDTQHDFEIEALEVFGWPLSKEHATRREWNQDQHDHKIAAIRSEFKKDAHLGLVKTSS